MAKKQRKIKQQSFYFKKGERGLAIRPKNNISLFGGVGGGVITIALEILPLPIVSTSLSHINFIILDGHMTDMCM